MFYLIHFLNSVQKTYSSFIQTHEKSKNTGYVKRKATQWLMAVADPSLINSIQHHNGSLCEKWQEVQVESTEDCWKNEL